MNIFCTLCFVLGTLCSSPQQSTKFQVQSSGLLKLLQEPHIILEQKPNIIEFVHQRAHSVDPESKREAGILLGIDANCTQHIWVDHARSSQLNPTRVLADPATTPLALETTEIKLGARLSEREIRRSKARDSVGTKHPSQKLADSPLQMSHCDASIHTQAFNLVKHWIVGRIGSVTPKDAARSDHPDRHATALHRMNLNGRSLRTKGQP